MVEAQEKAKELYNRFFIEVPFLQSNNDLRDDMNAAKRCALIAVDEIIKEYGTYFKININDKYVSYWQEVKEQIKKL